MFLGMLSPKVMVSYAFLRNLPTGWKNGLDVPIFSQQTNIKSFEAQAMLIGELLNEDYDYVLTRRLQSDPIENRFSKYRSMSGGRFLVSLREVKSSEKILIRRFLLKSGIDFWKCDLGKPDEDEKRKFEELISELESKEIEIMECSLSEDSTEVSH